MIDRRRFVLVTLAGALPLAGCGGGPPEAIIGVENPVQRAQDVAALKHHEIFVMTTRALDQNPSVMFSGERSDRLRLASMTVTVPPTHQPGVVERPRRLPPDPRKDFTVGDPVLYQKDAEFVTGIRRALATRASRDRSLLIFVHGYNTTLTAAVLRLAQFVEDTGYTGIPVLFSWASGGKVVDYVYDINSVLAARDDLLTGAALLRRTDATAADIVAHSMGNLLVIEAMRQAKLEGTYNKASKIRHVILASPDIDIDLFERQIRVFPKSERRFFIFTSRDDKALRVSRFVAGKQPRVGNADAARLGKLGVRVIDLTGIEERGGLNHAKFADSPEIVQLIGAGLHANGPLETSSQRTSVLRTLAELPVTVVGQFGG